MKKPLATMLSLPMVAVFAVALVSPAQATQASDNTAAKAKAAKLATLSAPTSISIGTGDKDWTAIIHVPSAMNGGIDHMEALMSFSSNNSACTWQSNSTSSDFIGNGDWQIGGTIHTTVPVNGDPTLALNSNDCAGPATMSIGFDGEADNGEWIDAADSASVDLVRRTKIEHVNAGPEPVSKGHTVTTVGSLQRASWGATPKYAAYTGKSVALQFRTKTGSYATVTHGITTSTGHLSKGATQSKNGCWRFRFGGNSVSAAANSGADCVALK